MSTRTMGVSLTSDTDLAQLAEAFDTFNLVSSQLEASYSSLQTRMNELRGQLADAREQRRAATADNARLQKRLSGILEALPGGVVVIDGQGVVTDANRRARSWLPGLDTGVIWSQLTADLFESEFSEHGDLVSRNGQQFVVTHEHSDGSEKIILLTDVTDQRRVDEVVARHRRLAGLGEMLATLAHQLRTPVTAALLYATNARDRALSTERREVLLDKAAHCMRDLEALVADMLVFARGNSARDEETVDVRQMLVDVERNVTPHRGASQTLQFAFPDSQISVRGNPRVLASALENIVVNALQCAGDEAHVQVCATINGRTIDGPTISDRTTHGHDPDLRSTDCVADLKRRFADRAVNGTAALSVRIEVSDNGPGIPAGDEERIFEPFYSSRRGGTGLGLAAARSIIAAHRGELRLLSEPGGGARFVVTMPLAEDRRDEPLVAATGAVDE